MVNLYLITKVQYEYALPHLLQLNADVITFECACNEGKDLPNRSPYTEEAVMQTAAAGDTLGALPSDREGSNQCLKPKSAKRCSCSI